MTVSMGKVVSRRALAGLLGLVGLLGLISMGGPVDKASAWYEGPFCGYYKAAPYGQPGDRCLSPDGNYFATWISGFGADHSACVDAYDQQGTLVTSWVCSGGPNQTVSIWVGNQFRAARGVMRNNTTGDTNRLYACQGLC